jgi:hypothetical protein
MGSKGLFMRSGDLVAAFRDMFVSSRDSFINPRDLLVIFAPTNGININNWLGGEDFYPFAHFHTWHALLLTLSHLSSIRGATPTGSLGAGGDCGSMLGSFCAGGDGDGPYTRPSDNFSNKSCLFLLDSGCMPDIPCPSVLTGCQVQANH